MVISAAVLIGYLIGSIPFGYIVVRFFSGKDIRDYGSGSTGATNVSRKLGLKWAVVSGLLDVGKGAIAVLIWRWIAPEMELLQAFAALAAILGHIFPVWIGFKGGKGINTAFGAALVISPWAALLALIAFASAFAIARFVSIGSISAVFVYTIVVIVFGDNLGGRTIDSVVFASCLPVIILWTHRRNIKRLIRHEELSPGKGKNIGTRL